MSKQSRIYDTLRARILAGAYRPGDRLVISAVAEDLGVSTVPVREAIRRLEAEGLVVYTRNAGARVAPMDADEFLDGLASLALLDGYATARARRRVDGALLADRTAQMQACMEHLDLVGYARANSEFHQAIYEACPNPLLARLVRDIAERLQTVREHSFSQVPYRGLAAIREHEQLIELLAADTSPEAIEAAARAHKLATAGAFRESLAQARGGPAVFSL